jgi:predicted XRE-type DNA-binding protein
MPRWEDPVPGLKRRVADEILVLTDGWSQSYAAAFMVVSQSRVSDLRRGNLDRISLDRLVQCLSRLGRRVEIRTSRTGGPSVHPHWRIDDRRSGDVEERSMSGVARGERVSRTG